MYQLYPHNLPRDETHDQLAKPAKSPFFSVVARNDAPGTDSLAHNTVLP